MIKIGKQPSIRFGRLWIVLLAIAIAGSWSCGSTNASSGGGTPTPTPTPVATPTPTPVTSPSVLELKVLDTSVPANGIFQFQLSTTEPKPIGHGSTRPQVPSGPVRGVAVNDPSGLAVGIAVVNGSNIAIQLGTPNGSAPQFGTDINYPIVTMSMQLTQNAQQPLNPGDKFTIGIANPVFFPDTSTQAYPTITAASGTLTIAQGGVPTVTDVIPGGGLLPDRSTIRILGSGFDSNNTRVSIEDTTIIPSDVTFVSANEIDVKICNGTVADGASVCPNTGAMLQLDGERVRVKDQPSNFVNEYYTYQRADDVAGTPSSNSLIAEVHPMFSRQTYTLATIPLVKSGTQFTGVSIQNVTGSPVVIDISLANDANVNVSQTVQVNLPSRNKITRDVIADFFGGTLPAGATKIKVSSPVAVQVLGMLGDTNTGVVTPVIPQ